MAEENKHVVTDESIQKDIDSGITKRCLGDRLYVQIQKKKHVYFRFRYSRDGKEEWERIGSYPEMSVQEARERASKFSAKLKAARQQEAEDAFTAKLTARRNTIDRKPTIRRGPAQRYPTFRTIEDAREFIGNLLNPAMDSARAISDEYRYLIALSLLIPARPNELIASHWKDVVPAADIAHSLLTIKKKREGSNGNDQIIFLSSTATIKINYLHALTGSSEYLFPKLREDNKTIFEEEVSFVISRNWRKYRINFNEFINYFKITAAIDSQFTKEFIDRMLVRDHGNESFIINKSNIRQRNVLFDWWGEELCPWPSASGYPAYANYSPPLNWPTNSNGNDVNVKVANQSTVEPHKLSNYYTWDDVVNWYSLSAEEIGYFILDKHQVNIAVEKPDRLIGEIMNLGGTPPTRVEIVFHADRSHQQRIENRCDLCPPGNCCHGAIILLSYFKQKNVAPNGSGF